MGLASSSPSITSICGLARIDAGSDLTCSPSCCDRSVLLQETSLSADSSSCMQGAGTVHRLLPLLARKCPSLKLILTRSLRNLLLEGIDLPRVGMWSLRDDIIRASIIVKKQMVVIQLADLIASNHNIRKEIDGKLTNSKYELLIGNYRLIGYISEGQFGRVYKAIDITNKRPVAVKLIDIDELMRKNQSENMREKLRKYLETEEVLMKKCHSAFVVKLYDSFENQRCKVLVMEYCRHGGLDNFIVQRGAIEEEDAVSILRQIILGLAELHQNNIIHRDLKPANILLHNGLFKIGDFGFCKEIQDSQAELEGTIAGTRTTMAPEVRSSGIYGLKADIWSLGMIYFMMVYPSIPLGERHNVARDIVLQGRKFDFSTVSGTTITQESSHFLNSVLQIDTSLRLNWEQVLEHPIFKVKFPRLPSVYVPGLDNIFHTLQQKKNEVKDQQALNLQRQLIDFQRLREESVKLVSQSKKETQQELAWNLDIDLLNRQYLECRISEYLLDSIVTPIEEKQLLNREDRFHIEFLFLVLSRCRENIIAAKDIVNSNYPEEICKHFQGQVEPLETKVRKRFLQQAERLKSSEDRMMEVVHDKMLQLFWKKQFQEKEKFLTLFERDSFTKEEQIKFTCEKYIVQLVNKLKGNKTDEQRMRRLLKSYHQINEINLEELTHKRIHQRIDEILEMYE